MKNIFLILCFITISLLFNGCAPKQKENICTPIILMQSEEYMQETKVGRVNIRNNGDILKRNNTLYEALKLCNGDKTKLREERDNMANQLAEYLQNNNK